MEQYLRRLWRQFNLINPHDAGYLIFNNFLQEKSEYLEKCGSLPRNDVKVQILGDAGAGKTSLRKKLMGENFDPNEGKTVGVDTRMCKSVDVDEKWKYIKSDQNEYRDKMSWLLAKTVIEENSKRENTQERMGLCGFLLIFLLFSFCAELNIILALNFPMENRFVMSLATIFITFALFADKTTSYKLATGLSLALVCIEKLCNFNEKYIHAIVNHTTESSYVLICGVYCCTVIGGFLLGILLSTSIIHKVLFGFSLLLAPCDDRYGAIPSFEFQMTIMTGQVVGFLAHKTYIKLRGKNFNTFTMWRKLKWAMVVVVILLSLLISFGFMTPTISRLSVYTVTSHTLIVFGISLGVEFGPTVTGILHLSAPIFFPIHTLFGLWVAHMCGYTLPTSLTTSSVIAGVSSLFILATELYLSKNAETGSKVPVRYVTQHVMSLKEFKRSSLPVKLSLWDFPGDELYYNTHHVFIASRAIFLVVFNLVKCAESIEGVMTRLLFWLHSISTHTSNPNSLIFIVGTHRDTVSANFRHTVADYLKRMLYASNSMYCNRLVINLDNTPLWVIENSIRSDEDVKKLQSEIRKRCMAIDSTEKSFPVRWLRFKSILQGSSVKQSACWIRLMSVLRKLKCPASVNLKGFIPFKDIFEYAQKHCGIKSREEMVRMLQFFHDTGHVIYINSDEVLRHFVLMNPRLLIDAFKLIVNVPEERDRMPTLASKWNRLASDGFIHHQLLESLLDTITDYPGVLVTLLQCYDFLCPLGRILCPPHGFKVDEYIIPSMRPVYNGDPDDLSPAQAKRFYFDFGFFKPDSIYSRLVSRCIQISRHYKVYHNIGRFTTEEFSFRIVLKEQSPEQHLISVDVGLVQGSNPYRLIGRLNSYVQAIRCREFPDLKYRCGCLCQFPSPHEGAMSENVLHILPLCTQEDEFPAIGSTVTAFCRAPQQIRLIPTNWDENPGVTLDRMSNIRDTRQERVEEDSPALYDIYVNCSQRDNDWVKDSLVRVLQNSEYPRYVKVNAYTNGDENATYIKNCPVNIVLISRFSAQDKRCEDERELAYLHHKDTCNVIHIFMDNTHRDVIRIKESLLPSHVCMDYIGYKATREDQVFFEELLELITNALQPCYVP